LLSTMHVPSPSDYTPFDSSAPGTLKANESNNYTLVAFVALVLYDHLITFDIEVERIWSLKWHLPKYLFLASRYIVPPLLLLTLAGTTLYPILPSFCTFIVHFHRSTQAISFVLAELVLLIRVSALYGHDKITRRVLVGLFVCQLLAVVVLTVFVTKAFVVTISYEFIPGCSVSYAWKEQFSWWIPFICFDGILFILALVRTLSYRNKSLHTVRVLARDSIVYYLIIFGSLVIDIVEAKHFDVMPIVIPAEWISCIAVSRMMMNIRGLVFDDPRGTQRIELPRIVFQEHCYTEDESDFEMSGLSTDCA